MKKIKLVLGIALVVLAFSACEMERSNSDKDSLSEIAGTYSGEFSDDFDLKSGVSDQLM